MKNKKVNAADTIKEIPHDPKEAIKADYDQTKADMKNIKDDTQEKMDEKKNEWDRE